MSPLKSPQTLIGSERLTTSARFDLLEMRSVAPNRGLSSVVLLPPNLGHGQAEITNVRCVLLATSGESQFSEGIFEPDQSGDSNSGAELG